MDQEGEPLYATLADFQKIKLRVAEVLSVEDLPHSEKLLKLSVQIGSEKRQIIAGIKKAYTAQELVGKKIIVIANLEPKKLAGELSEGMVLAAGGEDGKPVLLIPETPVESGTGVR